MAKNQDFDALDIGDKIFLVHENTRMKRSLEAESLSAG